MTETTRCAKCHGVIPRSRFAACATCLYGKEWSRTSVGAGKVAEEYERKLRRVAQLVPPAITPV